MTEKNREIGRERERERDVQVGAGERQSKGEKETERERDRDGSGACGCKVAQRGEEGRTWWGDLQQRCKEEDGGVCVRGLLVVRRCCCVGLETLARKEEAASRGWTRCCRG